MARLTKMQEWEREQDLIMGALRHTLPTPEPMQIDPDSWDIIECWTYNAHEPSISKTYYKRGRFSRYPDMRDATMRGDRLYASRADALAALRCAIERLSAVKLREIDRMASEGFDSGWSVPQIHKPAERKPRASKAQPPTPDASHG